MIGQIWARLKLLFVEGELVLIDGDKMQAKGLPDEVLRNVRRVQPFGFASRPKAGARAYVFFPAGDRSYGVSLVVADKRYQIELEDGEVALHDAAGNWVKLKAGGVIEAKAAAKVLADAPDVETTGNLKVGGNLEVVGSSLKVAGVEVGPTHAHQVNGLGAPSGPVLPSA